MASILKISDGTTTVDFLASSQEYRVTSWTPAVANRRRDALGGRGPYEDVEEEMVISIKSTTAAAKLNTLRELLLQAERWANGDRTVDAVLLHYKVESTSLELKTTILGPSGNAPMVELPPGFVFAPEVDFIDGVVLRFRRLGLWLGPEETDASALAIPAVEITDKDIIEVSNTGSVSRPVKLSMAGFDLLKTEIEDVYILLAADPLALATTKVYRLGAYTGFYKAGVGLSSVAVENNSYDALLRYTPAGTTVITSDTWDGSATLDPNARRWGMFISYRNNSASTSFRVRGNCYSLGGGGTGSGPWFEIPAGVSTPKFAYLGALTIPGAAGIFYLNIQASAASGTCDFDTFVLMAMDSPDLSRVIAIHSVGDGVGDLSLSGDNLIIDHRLLSDLSPSIYFDNSGGDVFTSYSGDAAVFDRIDGGELSITVLATGGDDTKYWRISDSTATVLSITTTAISRPAYLIPE